MLARPGGCSGNATYQLQFDYRFTTTDYLPYNDYFEVAVKDQASSTYHALASAILLVLRYVLHNMFWVLTTLADISGWMIVHSCALHAILVDELPHRAFDYCSTHCCTF